MSWNCWAIDDAVREAFTGPTQKSDGCRLLTQMAGVLEVNQAEVLSMDMVSAAPESFVIGSRSGLVSARYRGDSRRLSAPFSA